MTSLDIGVYGARGIPSTYSGYETFLTTLLPQLASRGHRVTMYCRTGEVDGSGPYEDVGRSWLPAVPGKQLNTLSHGALAAVVARARRHDVVLVVNVANAPFCLVNRVTGQPTVLNTDGQEWLRGKWGRVARTWFKTSARVAGWCASGLVADCAAMAEIYRDEFGSPSTVIPYCPPARPIVPTSVLDDLGVSPRSYFVVGGRLNPENNIDEVAARYADATTPQPLLVLGVANYESPVARNLESIAANDSRVRIVGHVGDRDQFFDLLHRATAYVHGHSVGGMNPSLVEAMHASANILAFDTPFNREVLGPDGRFFSLDTVAKEIDRESDLRADELAARGEAARRRAAEVYAVDDVVDAYEAVLVAAASAGRRRRVVVPTRWAP